MVTSPGWTTPMSTISTGRQTSRTCMSGETALVWAETGQHMMGNQEPGMMWTAETIFRQVVLARNQREQLIMKIKYQRK